MKTLVLASNNAGKLAELSNLLAHEAWEILPQSAFNVPECPEPHVTFVENALAKARHAARISQKPALADDSGICAEALGGLPGVMSARFAGSPKNDTANNAKMNEALQPFSNKNVFYICVLTFVRHEDDPTPIIAEGVWRGTWQSEAAGSSGFGYDPHFFVPELQQTAAQMSKEVKNAHSHRAQALATLLTLFKARGV